LATPMTSPRLPLISLPSAIFSVSYPSGEVPVC
jgi:hypothetical protein